MSRFVFTLLLLLLVIGCRSAVHGTKSSGIVHSSQRATSAKLLWDRTATIFQPLMPDTGKRRAESENRVALNRTHSDILPINHPSQSLYKAGSIFPSPLLASQGHEDTVLTVETAGSMPSVNPLQIQPGDSEAFQCLLREIAVVPASKRNVDDEKLKELLVSFRNEIMDSDFETDYLALLRKRILPETAPSTSSAPLPDRELLAVTKSPVRTPIKTRIVEPEYDDEDFYDEPIVRSVSKRTPQSREEPSVAQTASPVYPSLTQLPSAAPGLIQASYQAPYVHSSAISGYGAGDWQAPTRAAIEQLRYAIEQTPNGRTVSNEMRLRMLEMLLGNKAEAAKPMQTADKMVNGFMGNQILGFATLLDDSIQDNLSKYTSATYRFNEGLSELQKLCPIKLKNVMFVKDFFGYGQFIPQTEEFHPGEQFLVYMEIENPTVRRTADGFEVSVAVSYEIRDSVANVVVKQDAGKPADRTVSPKRDYHLAIPGTLPASLPPGQYQFRISLTDLNDDSMQYAEEQIPFRVAPALAAE